jgi:Flp pilus assembly CpaF family ATPase
MSGGALTEVRKELRERLLGRVDARGLAASSRAERRVRVRARRERGSDEVVGFGPIEFLLKDPEVTEVSEAK